LNNSASFQLEVISSSSSMFQFFISDSFVMKLERVRYLKNC
jgi:hypothetical protein